MAYHWDAQGSTLFISTDILTIIYILSNIYYVYLRRPDHTGEKISSHVNCNGTIYHGMSLYAGVLFQLQGFLKKIFNNNYSSQLHNSKMHIMKFSRFTIQK